MSDTPKNDLVPWGDIVAAIRAWRFLYEKQEAALTLATQEVERLKVDVGRYKTALHAIEAEWWKNAADENPILDPANATLMWELASNALENDDDEDAALSKGAT